jgi:hypothetical protein
VEHVVPTVSLDIYSARLLEAEAADDANIPTKASGLPIGLQIVGAPFAETTVLALAHAYERETAWHKRHPDLTPAQEFSPPFPFSGRLTGKMDFEATSRKKWWLKLLHIPVVDDLSLALSANRKSAYSKSFSLIDCISVGVDRMQRNFEPMRKQVEAWQRSELTDVTAKVVIYEAFVEGRLEAPKHLARIVHDLYFEPKYVDFRPRTIWSLSNAFTSAFKELDPIPQFKATAKLGEFLEARFSQSF